MASVNAGWIELSASDGPGRAPGLVVFQEAFGVKRHLCDERGSFNPAAARESWALTLAFLREKGAWRK